MSADLKCCDPSEFDLASEPQEQRVPSLYGGKLFNLLIDTKEEHAMMPLKQPQGPVILQTLNKHLATFKEYPLRYPCNRVDP
jgi:hypothetical protein